MRSHIYICYELFFLTFGCARSVNTTGLRRSNVRLGSRYRLKPVSMACSMETPYWVWIEQRFSLSMSTILTTHRCFLCRGAGCLAADSAHLNIESGRIRPLLCHPCPKHFINKSSVSSLVLEGVHLWPPQCDLQYVSGGMQYAGATMGNYYAVGGLMALASDRSPQTTQDQRRFLVSSL